MKSIELFLGESDTTELQALAIEARSRGIKTTGHTWQVLEWITEQIELQCIDRFILSGGGLYCLLSAITYITEQGKFVTIDWKHCIVDISYTSKFGNPSELFIWWLDDKVLRSGKVNLRFSSDREIKLQKE